MSGGPARAGWLCAVKELRRRAKAWLGLAIIFGLLGGGAIFAYSGAGRTGSAFDRLAIKTRSLDLLVGADCAGDACTRIADRLSTLPSVVAAAPVANYLAAMSTSNGRPLTIGDDPCYTGSGEVDLILPIDERWGSSVNRFDLAEGSLPDPASTDQVLIASGIARRFGLHIGDHLSLHGDACDQPEGVVPPTRTLRVVGIERSTFEQQPEVGFYLLGVHGTPRLLKALHEDGASVGESVALRLRSTSNEAEVMRQAGAVGITLHTLFAFDEIERGIARGTRPDSIALLIIGLLAAIAALVVVGPALVQLAAAPGPELRTLRVLGLTRADVLRVGAAMGLVVGLTAAGIAGVAAVVLSPFSPIGEARGFDPSIGFYATVHVVYGMIWTAAMVVSLTAIGTAIGAGRSRATFKSVTPAARFVRAIRLRPTSATGVRMALERRGNSGSALALAGVVVGSIGLIAALTFGSSLARFDRTPSVVGWNWDMAAFLSGGDNGAPPTAETLKRARDRLLDIPGVTQASLVSFFPPQFYLLEREAYPMSFSTGPDSIRPTVISGRAPVGSTEILINPRLAKRLGVTVGDRLDLRRADVDDPTRAGDTTTPFEVVGTGIVPLGDGRVDLGFALTYEGLSSLIPDSAPHLAVLNLEPGADRRLVRAVLAAGGAVEEGSIIDQVPTSSKLVQLDRERVASTPRIAAVLFAATAAAVLVHSVMTATRRRRRELAILRAIGFSARQATMATIWHAVISTLVAVVVAIPVGIAVGSKLWSSYAQTLGIQVLTSAPGREIALVAGAGVVGAGVVAFWPALRSARRSTAAILRTE